MRPRVPLVATVLSTVVVVLALLLRGRWFAVGAAAILAGQLAVLALVLTRST
jgi:hypothetical protein